MPNTPHPNPVCIIGNLNIDLILRDVPAMPAWGQEVFGGGRLQVSSGQAGYLAFALRRLGIPTSLVANVGDDAYGRQILSDLQASGADTRAVEASPGSRTGITVAIVRPDGERAFVSDLGCLADFSPANVQRGWAQVEEAPIACLVGLFCLPGLSLKEAARLLGQARAAGKQTMLDTGWDTHNWPSATLAGMRALLGEVTLFMPNWDEARAITGQDTLKAAARQLQDLGPETVVIKCGAQGSYALRRGQACQVAPRSVRVYDAVGAGDVFNAGFLAGLRQGWPMEACLSFGNSVASLYISREQDRFPTLAAALATAQEYPALRGMAYAADEMEVSLD